jgi:hypothetical protein
MGFLEAVSSHALGQVLFAHGSKWVEPFSFAPDVTTFLYQTVTHPWLGGALRMTDNGVQAAPPDERPDEELATEIVGFVGESESTTTLAQVLQVRDATKQLAGEAGAGLFRSAGARARQRAGSVVPSARFA